MEKVDRNKKEDKLKILAAGDFHGDSKIAQRLSEKAEKEKVDLVILTGDLTGLVQTKNIIQPFIDKKQRVIFVPGNWETPEEAEALSKRYSIKNIAENYVRYKDVGIFGVGNEAWFFSDEDKAFERMKTANERIKNLEKKIIVSHMHAAGTKSELSGFKGSDALKKAIEVFQPDIFISGHIHELEGVEERIGKTRIINVGKKGKIIKL